MDEALNRRLSVVAMNYLIVRLVDHAISVQCGPIDTVNLRSVRYLPTSAQYLAQTVAFSRLDYCNSLPHEAPKGAGPYLSQEID